MQEANQEDHHEVPQTFEINTDTGQLDINLLRDKLNILPDSILENKLLFIQGSSSYAIELVLRIAFPKRKAVLIIDNGSASLRLKRIASYLNIPVFVIALRSDPDKEALDKIRRTLESNSSIAGILMAYSSYDELSENEQYISQIAKKNNRILITDNTLLNSAKPGLNSLHFDYLISTLPLKLLGGKIFSYVVASSPRLRRLKKAANSYASGPV